MGKVQKLGNSEHKPSSESFSIYTEYYIENSSFFYFMLETNTRVQVY